MNLGKIHDKIFTHFKISKLLDIKKCKKIMKGTFTRFHIALVLSIYEILIEFGLEPTI